MVGVDVVEITCAVIATRFVVLIERVWSFVTCCDLVDLDVVREVAVCCGALEGRRIAPLCIWGSYLKKA